MGSLIDDCESYEIVQPKKEDVKPAEVDLQNLFRKVADYLGELKPDMESTILCNKENAILLKSINSNLLMHQYKGGNMV